MQVPGGYKAALFGALLTLSSQTLANCKVFLTDTLDKRQQGLLAYEPYVWGFIHGMQLACGMADNRMEDRKSPTIEFLSTKDCAGRQRAMTFLRLSESEKISMVARNCKVDPKRGIDRAILDSIMELR